MVFTRKTSKHARRISNIKKNKRRVRREKQEHVKAELRKKQPANKQDYKEDQEN